MAGESRPPRCPPSPLGNWETGKKNQNEIVIEQRRGREEREREREKERMVVTCLEDVDAGRRA